MELRKNGDKEDIMMLISCRIIFEFILSLFRNKDKRKMAYRMDERGFMVILENVNWKIDDPDTPPDIDVLQILPHPSSGNVKIEFVVGNETHETKEYEANNLRTLGDLLGSIYTYYNSPTSLYNVISMASEEIDRDEILQYLRENPDGPYYRTDLLNEEEREEEGENTIYEIVYFPEDNMYSITLKVNDD